MSAEAPTVAPDFELPPVGPIDLKTQSGITLLTCRGCGVTVAFGDLVTPEWMRRSTTREFLLAHRNCREVSHG